MGAESRNHLNGPRVVLDVDEGNVNIRNVLITNSGGTRILASDFVDQVEQGDMLDMSSIDLTVKHASAGVALLVGFAANSPGLMGDGEDPWVQALGVGLNQATDDLRSLTVELLGIFIRVITLDSGSASVAISESVTPDGGTQDEWERDGTPNDTFALEAGDAGDDIAVIFMFGGRF